MRNDQPLTPRGFARRQFACQFIGWLIGMAVGLALGQLATHLSADALWALLVVMLLPGALSLVGIAAGNTLYLRHLRAERDRTLGRSS